MIQYLWHKGGADAVARYFGYCQTRPALPETEWARVDSLFEYVATRVTPALFFELTDDPAEASARRTSVIFEPFPDEDRLMRAGIAMGFGLSNHDVSIVADEHLWPVLGDRLSALMREGERLLRRDQLVEALLLGLQGLYEILTSETGRIATGPRKNSQ